MFNKSVNLIIGIDLDEKILFNAREHLQPLTFDYIIKAENPVEMYIVKGDIQAPPKDLMNILNNGSLDFVSLVEVIEHMYEDCLENTVDVVFGQLKPKVVAITTPNGEFNVVFNRGESESNCVKKFRHFDHKFEWSRQEFESWCLNILEKYKDTYDKCNFDGVGKLNYLKSPHCIIIKIFNYRNSSD